MLPDAPKASLSCWCHRAPSLPGPPSVPRQPSRRLVPPGRHEHAKQHRDIIKTFPAERAARPAAPPHLEPCRSPHYRSGWGGGAAGGCVCRQPEL